MLVGVDLHVHVSLWKSTFGFGLMAFLAMKETHLRATTSWNDEALYALFNMEPIAG